MGTDQAIAPKAENKTWNTSPKSSKIPEWHSMGPKNQITWRDLPERYGKWTVVYSQFPRWRNSSVWEKMFVALQNTLKIDLRGDWRIRFINSTARDVYHQDAKVEWSPRKNSEVSRMQMVAALKALLHTIADETNNTKIPSTLSERKFNVS